MAVFDLADSRVTDPDYIFVDLKHEEKARAQLRNFGARRAFEVSKLAINKDIDPERLTLDDQLLNRLIARPFDTPMSGLLAMSRSKTEPRRGFLSALKQRLSS